MWPTSDSAFFAYPAPGWRRRGTRGAVCANYYVSVGIVSEGVHSVFLRESQARRGGNGSAEVSIVPGLGAGNAMPSGHSNKGPGDGGPWTSPDA